MFRLWRVAAFSAALLVAFALSARAQFVVFHQPPTGAGTIMKSAWYPPDGLDGDEYLYEDFTLAASTAITELRWRGGYTNYLSGAGKSPVSDFTITFYPSIGGNYQPDVLHPLVQHSTGGNAGETFAGTFGGVDMYDYDVTLPGAFMAAAGTTYWVQIEASQGVTPTYSWPPDWGFTAGAGGDNRHFRAITGGSLGGGTLYASAQLDAALTLLTNVGTTYTIAAAASPAGAGTITGAGPYPQGATATLTATPATGYIFLDWRENGAVVSQNPTWSFTVTANRTLTAEFAPARTVTVSGAPLYGGVVAGAGTFADSSVVTVQATPAPGFVFAGWTEYGSYVSGNLAYWFPIAYDCAMVAHFTPDGPNATFDFDHQAPALYRGQSIPFSQTSGPLTAVFSSPNGAAFSLQSDANLFYNMPWFSGMYLYPNDVYRNTLSIAFDHPLIGIYFTFATTDNHQTELTTNLQVTAYRNGTPIGTATAKGAYIGSTFPMGTLSYRPNVAFDRVDLVLPYQSGGTTGFFIDDITARLQQAVSAPDMVPPAALELAIAPNPARVEGAITFALPRTGPVSLAIFDLSGRRLRTLAAGVMPAGRHTAPFVARDEGGAQLPAGVYLVRLEAAGERLSRKLVMMR